MGFLDLTKKRKTIYSFSDKLISNSNLNKILEAARWAPSCSNSQPWEFIVVKNKEKVSELMRHVNYGLFHNNPSIIIACVLNTKKCLGKNYDCFIGADSHTNDTFMSVGIAAFSMTLEATELGIGSCLLTPKQDEIRKLLNVKERDFIPLLVGLGYEKKSSFKRVRKRNNLNEIVHYEKLK